MLSYSHALMNSCSRALQPSCPLAIVPPSSRIGKNQVTRCYFVIWLLVSSSLILSPALSSSQAKAYAPSVTRFPFLLVQVLKIVFPPRSFLGREGFPAPKTRPQELPKCSQDTSKSSPRRPKSCQRGSKRTPKTFQEHQKRSHSLIAVSFNRLMLS